MLSTQLWSAIYNLYELLTEECNKRSSSLEYFEKLEFRVSGCRRGRQAGPIRLA